MIQRKCYYNNLVYQFDEPFKVESYTMYKYGRTRDDVTEINVELFYSPFLNTEDAISTIAQGTDKAEQIFDLQGFRLSSQRKGINIVRNSEVVSERL